MTVYRHRWSFNPDGPHHWLRWRRRCACGWSQRQTLGWRDAGLNFARHLENMGGTR